jgi:hypothetical protein
MDRGIKIVLGILIIFGLIILAGNISAIPAWINVNFAYTLLVVASVLTFIWMVS